jgi:hypothetical protein
VETKIFAIIPNPKVRLFRAMQFSRVSAEVRDLLLVQLAAFVIVGSNRASAAT